MTINELKAAIPEYMRLRALLFSPEWEQVTEGQMLWVDRIGGVILGLAPEIMALAEAAEEVRMADTTKRGIELILGCALDAFNAKLETL